MQLSATQSQSSQPEKGGQYPGVWGSGRPIRVLTATGRPPNQAVDPMMLPMFSLVFRQHLGRSECSKVRRKTRSPQRQEDGFLITRDRPWREMPCES